MVQAKATRLDFLDGIRGLAALYVAFFHGTVQQYGLMSINPQRYWIITSGAHHSVGVFIVLSGYCLMLPVLRTGNLTLPKGFVNYITRRAKRLLPPYYAALGLSILLVVLSLKLIHGPTNRDLVGSLSPGVILSHIFMVHNLKYDWARSLNGPLWSLAAEWQLYLLFPLVLLPLYRRFGGIVTIVSGYCIGLLASYVSPKEQSVGYAAFWFIGLFAFGMTAAKISHTLSDSKSPKIPWGVVTASVVLASIIAGIFVPDLFQLGMNWFSNAIVGLVTCCLLIYCTKKVKSDGQSRLVAVLASKPLVAIGTFSYSIYLTHRLTQGVFFAVLTRLHLSFYKSLASMIVVGMPLVVFCGWIFFLLIERRCLNTRPT